MKKLALLMLGLVLSNIVVAAEDSSIYSMEYFFSQSHEPFHEEHLTKVSICQDETLAQCQEFASDKYLTFKNIDGFLTHDVAESTVEHSPLMMAYQSFEASAEMDDMVKNSIYQSDRVFAHVG